MPGRDAYPQIIAHRGASGYIPEHSLQAYQLAIDLKTDYIEPDLCLSKDGIFVAMHDLLLDDTTNVASLPQFVDRKTTKIVDGVPTTGYFISDFLYSELQELRLKQRLSQRTKIFDNYFTIPSFDQIMALAQSNYQKTNRTVGIYPELKHPTFFKNLGFAMEDMLLASLQKGGYVTSGDSVPHDLKQVVPVVIQCFEAGSLSYLKTKTNIPLIQLLNQHYKWTQDNINTLATYANGVGPEKSDFSNPSYKDGKAIVDMIHAAGLRMHPWTFRADMDIEPKFKGDFNQQNMYFFCCLGIDGGFSEFPDRTRESLDLISNYTAWTQVADKQSLYHMRGSLSLCPISCASFDN